MTAIDKMTLELGPSKFSEAYKLLCKRAADEQQSLQKHILA